MTKLSVLLWLSTIYSNWCGAHQVSVSVKTAVPPHYRLPNIYKLSSVKDGTRIRNKINFPFTIKKWRKGGIMQALYVTPAWACCFYVLLFLHYFFEGGCWIFLCLMHDAWFMMHDAWCMMHDAWCMMHDAWCTMHDAQCIIHDGCLVVFA